MSCFILHIPFIYFIASEDVSPAADTVEEMDISPAAAKVTTEDEEAEDEEAEDEDEDEEVEDEEAEDEEAEDEEAEDEEAEDDDRRDEIEHQMDNTAEASFRASLEAEPMNYRIHHCLRCRLNSTVFPDDYLIKMVGDVVAEVPFDIRLVANGAVTSAVLRMRRKFNNHHNAEELVSPNRQRKK